jgi:hypothetical protein
MNEIIRMTRGELESVADSFFNAGYAWAEEKRKRARKRIAKKCAKVAGVAVVGYGIYKALTRKA